MSICAKAATFIDGELPDDEHRAFEEHLASCARCPRALADYVELDLAAARVMARLSSGWGQLGLVTGLVLALFGLAVGGMFWTLSTSWARAENSRTLGPPAHAPVPASAGDRSSRGRR